MFDSTALTALPLPCLPYPHSSENGLVHPEELQCGHLQHCRARYGPRLEVPLPVLLNHGGIGEALQKMGAHEGGAIPGRDNRKRRAVSMDVEGRSMSSSTLVDKWYINTKYCR